MSDYTYLAAPNQIVSYSTEGYLLTITPMAQTTIESYDYYSQTVYVESVPQTPVVLTTQFTVDITVQ
ncbi:MAG: hypothetical protein KGH75_01335 [Rhodospirillales bacterium]|nr:hypothetical protein [Rhodospirillales bacterium]